MEQKKLRVKVEFIRDYVLGEHNVNSHAEALADVVGFLPHDTHSVKTECWSLKPHGDEVTTRPRTTGIETDLGPPTVIVERMARNSKKVDASAAPDCPDCPHPKIEHAHGGCMHPGEGDALFCSCTNNLGKAESDAWKAPSKASKLPEQEPALPTVAEALGGTGNLVDGAVIPSGKSDDMPF